MIFSLFKKSSKTTASEAATQNGEAQNPDADNADVENSRFSDFSPNESQGSIIVEEDSSHADADAEEAAMLYANRQNDEARSVLEEAVRHRKREAGEWLWRMLFDLYRIIGDHKAFDAMGIEYAKAFEKSPPV